MFLRLFLELEEPILLGWWSASLKSMESLVFIFYFLGFDSESIQISNLNYKINNFTQNILRNQQLIIIYHPLPVYFSPISTILLHTFRSPLIHCRKGWLEIYDLIDLNWMDNFMIFLYKIDSHKSSQHNWMIIFNVSLIINLMKVLNCRYL